MLTLRNIRVWDTGEIIDMVIPSADARNKPEPGGVIEADFDATGLTVAPGFADPHVHFRDPGQTYKESMVSGCRAAASGGYTNVLIMPNTVPAMDGRAVKAGASGAAEVLDAGCSDVIDYLQHYERVHDVSLPVRYDLCVCASKDRAGVEASDPADWLRHLDGHDMDGKDAWQLAHPVTAISDDGAAVTPGLLDQVLANVKESGLYLIEHCEHHDTGAVNDGPVSRKLGVPGIPEDTELKIVARDIEKARETGVHIHFQHVSTAISFDAIRKAKAEGLPITCETAPHYLALCDEDLLEYGTLAKMNPPLRWPRIVRQRLPRSRMARSTCWPPIMRPTRWRRRNAAPGGAQWHHRAGMRVRRVPQGAGRRGLHLRPAAHRADERRALAPDGPPATDVAALLNVTAPCASKRTWTCPPWSTRRTSTSPSSTRPRHGPSTPRSSCPRPATRPSADGMSPGVRWRPSSAPRWYSAAFTDGRFEPARKPAVSGGTDT